jgi:hypothetical protein
MQSRVREESIRALSGPVKAGARVQLRQVPVGDRSETLDLERFEVWAPNAQIVVDNGDGTKTTIDPPAMQYFRGAVAGDSDSMVFLAVRSDGATDGLVIANDKRYTVRSHSAKDALIEEVAFAEDVPADGGFTCDLDHEPILATRGVPTLGLDARDKVASEGVLSPTGSWTLNLAIETDNELYVDMGSNAGNVATFIGNVVGAASTIYKRDLKTDLIVTFSRIQATAADPWTIDPGQVGTWNGVGGTTFSTSHALAELGDIWANAGTRPFNGPRSSVVLLSGKNQTAGVAWIGTSCTSGFSCSGGSCGSLFDGHAGGGYAYIGLGNPSQTVPDPNATVNGVQYGLGSNYWPVLGLSHELGHNVNGPHTHCFALTAQNKTTYGVTRNFIDECYNGQGGCFSGVTSVPAEKGTVMSYCHLTFSGGFPQSRFLFGKAGEASELMATQIKNYIDGKSPASPAITAPASMGPGASSNASINGPVGGLTYDWTITNGTINGGTTGTTINFTATTNPVTLRVRATNASGCAASDYVNVTVNSCVAPSITSITPSQTLTLGSSVSLDATASGTGPITFQWYVGAPGNTSSPLSPGTPVVVSPTSSTTYWLRATGSCGTADSGAVNIGVVASPTDPTSLYIVSPCRVLDTRGPVGPFGGPALANLATRDVQITGVCGIPAGAKAVVANITAVAPTTAGFLSFYPAGSSWPGNSNLNYRAGKTRANNAILILSADGRTTARNVGATQHFIIDVTGYFQ